MAELRHRYLELQADTIKIVHKLGPEGRVARSLRVTARAERTLKPAPNKCEIEIYNLTPAHRAALSEKKAPVVSLIAGYEGEKTLVFYGQLTHVSHERRPDRSVVTTLSTSDGGPSLNTARVHKTFAKGTKAGDVMAAIVKSFGLKVGNLAQAQAKLNAGKLASVFIRGTVLNGHAPEELTALCRSAGLEWSIQSGGLQFLDLGAAVTGQAIVLTESHLTAAPSVGPKGVVESQTLLQKDFLPGKQVQLKHEFVTGAYRLEECRYDLDTHGQEWYVDFTGAPLGARK